MAGWLVAKWLPMERRRDFVSYNFTWVGQLWLCSKSFVHDFRMNHQRRTLSEVGMINSSEQAVFVWINRQVGLRLPRQLWKELESLFNVVHINLQRQRARSLVFPKLCGAYCVSIYKCTLIDWWCYSTWDGKITQNACTFVCHFKTCVVMMIF